MKSETYNWQIREERKRLAEQLYGEGWTMQRIAEVLHVSQATITRDLVQFIPVNEPARPKGGRPKESVNKPGPNVNKPAPPPGSAEQDREIAQLKAQLEAGDLLITRLKARIAELEAAKPPAPDARVAELEAALKKTKRGFIWSVKEYRNILFCIHPDRVKFLNDESLAARFHAAFQVVQSSEGVVVDKHAEDRDAEHHARERDMMERFRKGREAWERKQAAQEAARRAKAKERYDRKKAEKAAAKAAQA
jgi:hypothetical protein